MSCSEATTDEEPNESKHQDAMFFKTFPVTLHGDAPSAKEMEKKGFGYQKFYHKWHYKQKDMRAETSGGKYFQTQL